MVPVYVEDGHHSPSIKMGEGSRVGHVGVYPWSLSATVSTIEAVRQQKARRLKLCERIAHFLATDPEAQALLEAEAEAQRLSRSEDS